jgi:hypothetical protein
MKRTFLLTAWLMQLCYLHAQSEQQMRDAARASFEAHQLIDPATGKIPLERLLEAYQAPQAKLGTGQNWIEMGPRNRVGGRTRAIAISPDRKKIFAGGITGGLWVSDYKAIPDWKPVGDFFANLNVSTIAFHPKDSSIMYIVTIADFFIQFDTI